MRKTYRCMKITHLYNRKPLPRCSLNVIFCCIWNQKNQNKQKYLEKYRKVFENLLTNREHGVILCTEKNESETEFWLFFRLILQI